jgi:hypothetical protein
MTAKVPGCSKDHTAHAGLWKTCDEDWNRSARVMIDKISGKELILRYVNAIPAAVVSVG